MKCNHCNSEVAEGTKFCPECGNRIEQPQPLKCPQCNTVVGEGTKFCPECGSPIITEPKPIICSNCGTEIENGEKFCSNCGTPVGGIQTSQPKMMHSTSQSNSSLHLCWDGERQRPFWNNPIGVYANDQKCTEFFPKETFEKTFSDISPDFDIQLEYGKGPFNKTSLNLKLENGHSYTCIFFMNVLSSFGYELKDENGRLVKEDGNFGWLHFILCMLIPLAGFIFFFIKKDAQPLSAKTGLIVGFCNIGLIALRLVFG
jgi:RNA polymerase subunit RPABC4/transcription elongation factor Spt4